MIIQKSKFKISRITSDQNNNFNQEKFNNIFPKLKSISHVRPHHRLNFVTGAMNSTGKGRREIVSFIGDSICDGPAINAADIGIVMVLNLKPRC